MSENIIPHKFQIDRQTRENFKGHTSFVIWFTGLSGSGKSTVANLVEQALFEKGVHTYSLDGDNVRSGLNKGLTFSMEDRREHLRRIAELAKLFVDSGTVVIASFISPLKKDRDFLKNIIGADDFIEVFVNTSVEECERRDVKGLYAKARAGEIQNFTGIDAPYEKPQNPDVEIETEKEELETSVKKVLNHLQAKLEITR